MSEEDRSGDAPDQGDEEPGAIRAPDPPRLRRRPLGYSRSDVEEALAERDGALEQRERELTELRQDVAALWLAFAQHDHMIREALARPAGGEHPLAEPPSVADPPDRPAEAPPPDDEPGPSVARQLSDLDDVLAAIELATQTLERTYSDEIAEPDPTEATERSPSEESSSEEQI